MASYSAICYKNKYPFPLKVETLSSAFVRRRPSATVMGGIRTPPIIELTFNVIQCDA